MRFALLVVAWFVTATALASAVAAAISRARGPILEQLAALVAVGLPVGALVAVGLFGLPAGFGALVVAAVELACLGLWNSSAKRGVTGASD